jgi:hypothetical protein
MGNGVFTNRLVIMMHAIREAAGPFQRRRQILVSCNANTLHNSGAFLHHAALLRLAIATAMARCSALPDTKNHSEFTFANLRYRTLGPVYIFVNEAVTQATHL